MGRVSFGKRFLGTVKNIIGADEHGWHAKRSGGATDIERSDRVDGKAFGGLGLILVNFGECRAVDDERWSVCCDRAENALFVSNINIASHTRNYLMRMRKNFCEICAQLAIGSKNNDGMLHMMRARGTGMINFPPLSRNARSFFIIAS